MPFLVLTLQCGEAPGVEHMTATMLPRIRRRRRNKFADLHRPCTFQPTNSVAPSNACIQRAKGISLKLLLTGVLGATQTL